MFNQKILCVGNNTEDTDVQTTNLALKNQAKNYGLLTNNNLHIKNFGYYHACILDLTIGDIISIAKQFDKIIMLDQAKETWPHWKPLLSTYKLMVELEKLGHVTEYKNNKNIEDYQNFFRQIEDNKSFCIYPWINLVEENGHLQTCARSSENVTTFDKLKDWQNDPDFKKIRNKMLKGELLPTNCSYCYDYENKNIESYRQFETKEWISKLEIKSIQDLDNITHPYYYEIRLSNKCNLMCRSCQPAHSHLIDREYKKFKIVHPQPQVFEYSNLNRIDIDSLSPKVRVYLTGGEPTIMTEVYTFMKKCIAQGKTDFDFTLGTNAAKISSKFLDLSKNFTNMNFSVSLDGYGKINDYWRWGSQWDQVIANTKLLESFGHNISINCVPGIYNITNLHLLYEFLDKEFKHAGLYLQINRVGCQSAYNHPNHEMVLESLNRCKQTKTYYTDGKSNKTAIDSLYDHYSNKPECDLQLLKEFFEYNDKLDAARNSRLGDYIPELEECRKYIGGIV